MFTLGSYEFSNPGFHGTPFERMRAFNVGYGGLNTTPAGDPITPLPGHFDNCVQEFWKVDPVVVSPS